jgi:hypothetical protein
MFAGDPEATVNALLEGWHNAFQAPGETQEQVLRGLVTGYAQTEYGRQHGAQGVITHEEFRRAFPITTYDDYQPLMQRVMSGETGLLLYEDPIGWAITRGTTSGESKFIPMTPTDLRMRLSAGRAMMEYVAATNRFDLFDGVNLNPTSIGGRKVSAGERCGIRLQLRHLHQVRLRLHSRCARSPSKRRSMPSAEEDLAIGVPASSWPIRRGRSQRHPCRRVTPTALLSGATSSGRTTFIRRTLEPGS